MAGFVRFISIIVYLCALYDYFSLFIQRMKITLLQQNIVWADPEANVSRIDALLERMEPADLYVFPEMFSTGFATNPQGIAEKNGFTLDWMKRTAANRGCALAGSVAVEKDGLFYNRFYFVHPDGRAEHYDKHHLFTYGGEDKTFTAGNERVIVTHCGVRILLQICYDLRFPVFSRNRGDYDMIIYVASWPTPRVEAWKALLVARAIENQCYVAAVNRVGEDPACSYCGGTMLIDSYGRKMEICPEGKESSISGIIDLEELRAFRRKFPVLNDADSFLTI